MTSKLPRIVGLLTHNFDAWIVGSAADPSVTEPRDWDLIIPWARWHEAVSVIPGNARPNSFGGWKVKYGDVELDIWPGDLTWLMQRPRSRWAWHPASGIRLTKNLDDAPSEILATMFEPCMHAQPQADSQLHGICIFCYRDRLAALVKEVRVRRDAESGGVGYWSWQGDGSDEPESITCPVLIQPDDLRTLLKIVAAAKQWRIDGAPYVDRDFDVPLLNAVRDLVQSERSESIKMVDQKIDDPNRGDCFTACLMAVLGLPYDRDGDSFREWMQSIVETMGDDYDKWGNFVTGWCVGRGIHPHYENVPKAKARGVDPKLPPDGQLVIAGGTSPRGADRGHAIVMQHSGGGAFAMVHDPHPSRAGIVGEVEDYWWFTRI